MGIISKFHALFKKSEIAPTVPADLRTQESGPLERRQRERLGARDDIRMLIIDDSPTVCMALKKILRSAGYITEQAYDAEKGLEIVRIQPPHLIFLDIVLPGMNGFSALRALRRDPVTRQIPVIMISGNEQATEQFFFGSAIGADDFMKKPFSRFEVFARVERLLDADLVPRRKAAGPNEMAGATQTMPLAPATFTG